MNTYLLSLKRKVSKETFRRVTVMISDTSETFVTRLVPFAVLFSRKVPLSERKVSKETFGVSRLLLRLRSKTSRLLKILLPFSFQGRYL